MRGLGLQDIWPPPEASWASASNCREDTRLLGPEDGTVSVSLPRPSTAQNADRMRWLVTANGNVFRSVSRVLYSTRNEESGVQKALGVLSGS